MAFTAYTGLPGSGKSYNVVKHILIPAVKQGRPVWTNIPLNEDEWIDEFAYCPKQFKTEDLQKNPNWLLEELPQGVLCVIDETQLIWPSGMSVKQFTDEQREFFSMHRHMVGEEGFATQIILVTQDLGHIANYLRSLTQSTFHHKKLVELGVNKYVVTQYTGAVTGNSPSEKQVMNRSAPRSYKKEVYRFYKSSTKSESGQVGDEVRADKRASIFSGSRFWMYVIGGVLVPIMGIWGVTTFFKNFGKDDANVNSPQPVQVTQAQSGNVIPRDPATQSVPAQASKVSEPFKDYDIFIASNIGVYPRIDYRFFIRDRDSSARLGLAELRRVGYSVTPIDDCLVVLEWDSKKRYAMCELPEDLRDDDGILSTAL